MLTSHNQLSPVKTAVKINSISTESTQLVKKRSYSLRKLQKHRPVLNLSPGINAKLKNPDPALEPQKESNPGTERPQFQSPIRSRYGIFSSSKLSPIKQYETKLKISAESWLVYDYRKDSYKRGWRPAEVEQFSGMARLLVFKVFLQLMKSNPELKNFNIRVNHMYLKEQVQLQKQQKLPANKRKGLILREQMSRILDNNIMINIIDLFYGLFMTNYDDLLEYAIIFIGYLCECQRNGVNPLPEDGPCHFVEKVSVACGNAQALSSYAEDVLFPMLEMGSSKFIAESYTFESCANDICRLYLSLQESDLFKEIIKCKELNCKIKYQIGFRYWENRTLVFKNRRIDMGHDYSFIGNWKCKKNYGVVSRNEHLNILIVLQDCKYGMAECDIINIESWVKELMRPIVDMRKTHAKLLPLLRVGHSRSPQKKQASSQRTITEVNEKQ